MGGVISCNNGHPNSPQAEFSRNIDYHFASGQRVGGAHVCDEAGATCATQRQDSTHTGFQKPVVTQGRVSPFLEKSRGKGSLAETLKYDGIEVTPSSQVDSGIQAVGRKSRACANPETLCFHYIMLSTGQRPEGLLPTEKLVEVVI
jgi:hypothetical protein